MFAQYLCVYTALLISATTLHSYSSRKTSSGRNLLFLLYRKEKEKYSRLKDWLSSLVRALKCDCMSIHFLCARRFTTGIFCTLPPAVFMLSSALGAAWECHPDWSSPWTGALPWCCWAITELRSLGAFSMGKFPCLTIWMFVLQSRMKTVLFAPPSSGNPRQQAAWMLLLALNA